MRLGLGLGLQERANIATQPVIDDSALVPSLFVDGDTFHAATVTATTALTPALFADGDSFFTPVVVGETAPLDGLSGVTGAWSAGRKMLTAYGGSFYTDVSGFASEFLDQSGSARNFTRATAAARPAITTGGPNSRALLDFRPPAVDGTSDSMEGPALSNFISNSTGYFVASFIPDDAARTNFGGGAIFANDQLFGDASTLTGVVFQNGNMVGFNNDGGYDIPTGHAVSNGTAYVVEWWHEGGNLNTRLNGGTTNTVASGNTTSMTGLLRLGTVSNQADFKCFEMAAFSTVPSGAERDAIVANLRAWCGA